ncbi:MAG: hypothetical protein ACHQNT_10510 [Bacteroidia bacterium]
MKRTFIATIVGTIIIFIYQALSWMALPIHQNSMKYTSTQDSVLAMLNSALPEDGFYMMPIPPPGTPQEDHEKFFEPYYGKPWAAVSFHKAMVDNMGSGMIVSFILNFFSVWIIVLVLTKASGVFNTFSRRFWVTLAFSFFTLLQAPLMEWNWWQSPAHYIVPEIIDELLACLLVGIWLGWYLGRTPKAA